MIRLAHVSDIHVSAKKLEWKIQDLLNKRFAGWINYRWLGRRYRFRHAKRILPLLIDELRARRPDHIIFSGDATALGFESEMKVAAELLHVEDETSPPGLAVPGNHDYSTKAAAHSGLFEKYFGRWQQGERVDEHPYPFAQHVPPYWLIGVNSAVPNRWAWDATGWVGPHQTERFQQLVTALPPGPRILVTHYPVRTTKGKSENSFRRLRDLLHFIKVAEDAKISLWLHGHRHRCYYIDRRDIAPFPIICAGSVTQTKRWNYCEYVLTGNTLQGVRRVFDKKHLCFRDDQTFALTLPNCEASV